MVAMKININVNSHKSNFRLLSLFTFFPRDFNKKEGKYIYVYICINAWFGVLDLILQLQNADKKNSNKWLKRLCV